MATEKKISRPTSWADNMVIATIPSFRSSTLALRYLLIRCSAITTAPSTMIPKSIAPRDNKLAGIPVNRMMINANNSENGIVKATTNALLKLPKKKIKTRITILTPSNKVFPTVSKEWLIRKLLSYSVLIVTPSGRP